MELKIFIIIIIMSSKQIIITDPVIIAYYEDNNNIDIVTMNHIFIDILKTLSSGWQMHIGQRPSLVVAIQPKVALRKVPVTYKESF